VVFDFGLFPHRLSASTSNAPNTIANIDQDIHPSSTDLRELPPLMVTPPSGRIDFTGTVSALSTRNEGDGGIPSVNMSFVSVCPSGKPLVVTCCQ
jgi:hypothetical protein